jgi:hypothetical protein
LQAWVNNILEVRQLKSLFLCLVFLPAYRKSMLLIKKSGENLIKTLAKVILFFNLYSSIFILDFFRKENVLLFYEPLRIKNSEQRTLPRNDDIYGSNRILFELSGKEVILFDNLFSWHSELNYNEFSGNLIAD